jgi:hypothetical protein
MGHDFNNLLVGKCAITARDFALAHINTGSTLSGQEMPSVCKSTLKRTICLLR